MIVHEEGRTLEIEVSGVKELIFKTDEIKEKLTQFICAQESWDAIITLKIRVENYLCEIIDTVQGLRFTHPTNGWIHPFDRLMNNYRMEKRHDKSSS